MEKARPEGPSYVYTCVPHLQGRHLRGGRGGPVPPTFSEPPILYANNTESIDSVKIIFRKTRTFKKKLVPPTKSHEMAPLDMRAFS